MILNIRLLGNIKLDKRYNIGEEIEVKDVIGEEIIKRKLGVQFVKIEESKEPKKVDYNEINYNDLRKLAKERGLDLEQNPSKEELVEVLEKSDKE